MSKAIPYILSAVLLVALIISLTNRKEVVKEVVTNDTVRTVKLDTLRVPEPIFLRDTIVDTIYLENGLKLPVSQRFYKGENYNAWISGYMPSLDSINIFTRNEIVTVTKTITQEKKRRLEVFVSGGVTAGKGIFIPNINIDISTRNRMVFGAGVGLYDKQPVYTAKIGYRLWE